MILDFDDSCWLHDDDDWRRSLIRMLVLINGHEQHAVLATPDSMIAWVGQHLPLFVDYFKARLTAAQPRARALSIRVSPNGSKVVGGAPPWDLTADAARQVIEQPLRLVLENNDSDRLFVESTIPQFSNWRTRNWISPEMGGGTAMALEIAKTSSDPIQRWRTFFLFDSDRLHPDELSPNWNPPAGDGCQGHQFEVACAQMPVERWHRLDRRSIENYLPSAVLASIEPGAAATLFSASVGSMALFYNVKRGLAGDGVSPLDAKKVVRASRSQNFWTSLDAAEVKALEAGFGPHISSKFSNVPSNHSWPADVTTEMDALAASLQDSM